MATGKLSCPPFPEGALDKLRKELASTVSDPNEALRVPEGQPFYLNLVAQSLRLLGDPDWSVLTQGTECFANGMPIGFDQPLPRAPQVFKKKTKFRKCDDTLFEPDMTNYASAEISADQVEEHFREDERLGRMVATTEAAARREYGDRVLIAAMGAVAKPNGDIRPLHDGTHGVRLNPCIRIQDQLEVPGPSDLVEVVARATESNEAVFYMSADISQAHRQVKIRPQDWPAPWVFFTVRFSLTEFGSNLTGSRRSGSRIGLVQT